jgi:hypothetical protein
MLAVSTGRSLGIGVFNAAVESGLIDSPIIEESSVQKTSTLYAASPSVKVGTATWYGSTSGYKSYCYGGYKNTCTPYASGELVMYGAVGDWHYHDKTYRVEVCRVGTTKCVIVTVRDYCHGAHVALKKPWTKNSRLIDLSPSAFMQLGSRLSRGIMYVSMRVLP